MPNRKDPVPLIKKFSGHIVAALVAFAFAPFFIQMTVGLTTSVHGYSPTLLYSAFAIIVTIGTIDFFRMRHDIEILLAASYLLAIISFLVVSYFLAFETKSTNSPLIVWILLIILARQSLAIERDPVESAIAPQNLTGLAAAGVLVVVKPNEEPYFVLVHNKNIRGGLGLWVPPGGHINPETERPEIILEEKIRAETGYSSKIFQVNPSLLPVDPEKWESCACVWLIPPAFLLREDLLGLCSKGHGIHVDLCYICVSTGEAPNKSPKYGGTAQAHILVKDCLESFGAAQATITGTIDRIHKQVAGVPQGVYDDLTQDVIWRLHLTAKFMKVRGELLV